MVTCFHVCCLVVVDELKVTLRTLGFEPETEVFQQIYFDGVDDGSGGMPSC